MVSMGIWAFFLNIDYFEHQMLITLNMDIISQPKFSVIYFIQVYMEMFFTPNTSLIWKPKELITSKKNNLCKITTRKPYIYIIIIFTLKLIFLS